MPQRVAILGGTFDPVHVGHLRIAEEAAEALQLDSVRFIPAALPPHKAGFGIASFEDRWRMLELAIAGNPRFALCDLERRLPGKSYTVITLRKLHEESPGGGELYFLVGLDAFLELHTWWHFEELFQLAHIVVLRRPGYEDGRVGTFLARRVSSLYAPCGTAFCFEHPHLLPVHTLENTPMGISSTHIRRLAAEGRSIRYLVLPEVMRYIEEKKLYLPRP